MLLELLQKKLSSLKTSRGHPCSKGIWDILLRKKNVSNEQQNKNASRVSKYLEWLALVTPLLSATTLTLRKYKIFSDSQ